MTDMQRLIQKIVTEAVHAPSGENCQPWTFAINGETLFVFNDEQADFSLYNQDQKASYFAHGALLENIAISSKHYGYESLITVFPKEGDRLCTASITFLKNETIEDELYPYIFTRTSNRQEYEDRRITKNEEMALIGATNNQDYTCHVVNTQKGVEGMAKGVAMYEKIIFTDKNSHAYLFEHIIWHKKEENEGVGLYIKTIESAPYKIIGMRVLANWTLVSFLNYFGLSSIIYTMHQKKYTQSGAFAAIITKGNTNKDYILAGRAFQRVWLTAEKLGLSVEVHAGVLYMMKYLEHNENIVTVQVKKLIRKGYSQIEKMFDKKGTITIVFRLGYAPAPLSRSERKSPIITIDE